MADNERVQVLITDREGKTVREYEAELTERDDARNMTQLEATYDGRSHELGEAHVEPGDRLIIRFYDDRLYNVIWLYDHRNHRFEGWYCNFIEGVEVEDGAIRARSLSLALYVRPDKNGSLVINRDAFERLDIPRRLREDVEDALAELLEAADMNLPPFGTEEPMMPPADRSMPGPEENLAKDPKRNIDLNNPRTDRRRSTED